MIETPRPPATPVKNADITARVRVLSVLVEDGSNTLSKISGLIRRRGFHVRSISVGPTPQAGRSRMTLTVDAGHAEADQVRKQLERLVEVIEVEDVTGEDVHSRELVVAKVKAAQVSGLVERGAKVLNTSADGTTVEDRPVKVPDFLATICVALGIDPTKQNNSNVGRPIRLADKAAQPIKEVLG